VHDDVRGFLLARLMGQYWFARRRRPSSVTLPAGRPAGRRGVGGRAANTPRRASSVTSLWGDKLFQGNTGLSPHPLYFGILPQLFRKILFKI